MPEHPRQLGEMKVCWLSAFAESTACEGRLVRVHLLPRRLLRDEFPEGAIRVDGRWLSVRRARRFFQVPKTHGPLKQRSLRGLQEDPATWVWACGGAMGPGGHHGMLDNFSRRMERIPREALPADLEVFAEEFGLGWWLDRTYGERAVAA